MCVEEILHDFSIHGKCMVFLFDLYSLQQQLRLQGRHLWLWRANQLNAINEVSKWNLSVIVSYIHRDINTHTHIYRYEQMFIGLARIHLYTHVSMCNKKKTEMNECVWGWISVCVLYVGVWLGGQRLNIFILKYTDHSNKTERVEAWKN